MLMLQSESIDSQMQMKNKCRQNYIYRYSLQVRLQNEKSAKCFVY